MPCLDGIFARSVQTLKSQLYLDAMIVFGTDPVHATLCVAILHNPRCYHGGAALRT